jgi:glycosyltransferase involved in cell wall biosynthesis
MKVAVIAPTYLPARRANTIQVMKMASALAGLNHEVQVIVPGPAPAESEASWEALSSLYGLHYAFSVSWQDTDPRLRSYDFGLQSVSRARNWQADLIYTRHPQAAALASLSGLPTILEVHDLPRGRFGPVLYRAFLRGSGARRLVVITHALADDLASSLGGPAKPPFRLVLPDGVDLERYAGLPEPAQARQILASQAGQPMPDTSQFTVGYTGHLYAGRGTHLLLELARQLSEVAFLLVGGDPQDIESLRSTLTREALSNVFLAGFVPNSDLPVYQAACDILLMPYQQRVAASSGGDISRYLSPMKLFEYLACQRPILSSDLSVLREILNSNLACLLPPDNPVEWVNAIRHLKANPDHARQLAERAMHEAQRYTWEARAKRLLEF